VNVTCVTDDGVNEHVVPELVLSTPVSAGKPDFRNFMAPTLNDFDYKRLSLFCPKNILISATRL
jgi:hypothetical protein